MVCNLKRKSAIRMFICHAFNVMHPADWGINIFMLFL